MHALHSPRAATAIASFALLLTIAPVQAFASTAASAGSARCTISARQPRLDFLTLKVRGSAAVVCTASTVVGVETGVVEMDGFVESGIVVRNQTRWVVVVAGVATVVTTNRVACVNTEPGFEEYATKARVIVGGNVSAWDRTVPEPDSFAC